MTEDYVGRSEFNNLTKEVEELKQEIDESRKLLQQIDKKIDVISEKIINSEKIDNLKMKPIEKRIQKLEEHQSWLSKTVAGTIIGIIIKLIFDLSKYVT